MNIAVYSEMVKMYSPMNEANEVFVQWILDGLKEHGWSQSELARQAGMTRGAISNIINNYRNKPTPETIRALARAFGKPEEEGFRAAGLLEKSEFDPADEELLYLFDQLTEEEQEEVLAYARMRLERQNQKNAQTRSSQRVSRNRPQTESE